MTESFSDAELDDPLRAAKRLVLASQDMSDAAEAAALLTLRSGSRILETALAVSYARPWTKATIEPLDEHWAPTDSWHEELHDHLIDLRSKLYAHNDDEFGARGIRDVGGHVGAPSLFLVSEWRSLKPELYPVYEDLSKSQPYGSTTPRTS